MNKTLFAIPGLVLALSGSAFASQSWEAQSVQTGLAAMDSAPLLAHATVRGERLPAVRVPAGSPTFFTNYVATGAAVNGVPCFNCVNGAPQNALGLPSPFNYVPSGTVQQYDVTWTDLTFNGTCKVFISVASGKTVIGKGQYTVPGISAPGAYAIGLNFAAVTYSGPAIVTGKITCGGKSSSSTAPLVFQ